MLKTYETMSEHYEYMSNIYVKLILLFTKQYKLVPYEGFHANAP